MYIYFCICTYHLHGKIIGPLWDPPQKKDGSNRATAVAELRWSSRLIKGCESGVLSFWQHLLTRETTPEGELVPGRSSEVRNGRTWRQMETRPIRIDVA